jgi:hypothetical protein
MASGRLSYDGCAETQRNTERITPLDYQLYSPKSSLCDWCGKKDSARSELIFADRVVIENDLYGIDRKQSKCSEQKYQPPSPMIISELANSPTKFTPAITCQRNVVWTNLVKPTSNGLPSLELPNICQS